MNSLTNEAWSDITVANEIIRTRLGRVRCARQQLGRALTANGQRHLTLMRAFEGYWDFGSVKAAAEGEIQHLAAIANIRADMPRLWKAWRQAEAAKSYEAV